MTAGRDPVDRVIDVMVGMPVAAAVATRRALPLLARAGRRSVRRLAARADAGAPASPGATVPSAPAVGGDEDAEAPAERFDGSTELPIDGYDHLAARQVCDRLPGLSRDELAAVATYERAHRARRTVLGKIEQLTA